MTPPTRGSSRRCFISHAHADNALCTPYAEKLRASAVDIWYDLDNAPEGHRLTTVLQRELQAREALIVFVTPAALDSFWVDLEIAAYLGLMAQDRSRMLLPMRLAPCELPPFLNSVLWIDAVGLSVDEAVARAIRALNSVPLPEAAAPAIPSHPSYPPVAQQDATRVSHLPGHHDVVGAVSGVVGGVAGAAEAPEAELARRLVAEARAETLASHWNDAIIKMEFAFSLAGKSRTVSELADLAQAYAGAGRWSDALDAAKQAATQNPLRADLWQMQGRAHTAIAAQQRAVGGEANLAVAADHERDALAAFDRARALIAREDLPARLALLADRRAALISAARWEDALVNVEDELLLAPNAPTRLSALMELLARQNRADEALAVARTLAARVDASPADHLALARMLQAADAPRTEIETALDAAKKAAGEDAAQTRRVAQARAELISLPARLARLGFRIHTRDGVEWITPPTCPLPAGPFTLGSDKNRDKNAQDNEVNRVTIDLPAVQIARYPVTVAEFACFLAANSSISRPTKSNNGMDWSEQLKHPDHPVCGIIWFFASEYVDWLSDVSGQPWRLPSEAIWEKAARFESEGGANDRIYPWGDEFDATRCNADASNQGTTTPVGWYGPREENLRAGRKSGASPCGAEDMSGNVREWTASVYPSDHSYSNAGRLSTLDNVGSGTTVAMRGGSWGDAPESVRSTSRFNQDSRYGYGTYGFRLVLLAPDPVE
jgi:formylglycine-generating enzyme required for sulfatase activity